MPERPISNRTKAANAFARFLKQYARKRGRNGMDPNDRGYDLDMKDRVRRMRPQELDALARHGADDLRTQAMSERKVG